MPNVVSLSSRERMRADRDEPMAALNEKDLAGYICDMLGSLRACARHPDFKALHALMGAAEAEARALTK